MMDIISKVVKANILIYFKHCVDLNLIHDIILKGTIKCTLNLYFYNFLKGSTHNIPHDNSLFSHLKTPTRIHDRFTKIT